MLFAVNTSKYCLAIDRAIHDGMVVAESLCILEVDIWVDGVDEAREMGVWMTNAESREAEAELLSGSYAPLRLIDRIIVDHPLTSTLCACTYLDTEFRLVEYFELMHDFEEASSATRARSQISALSQ